jgi:hypothetical protein
MKNPWLALPRRPPFVLPADRAAVLAFNGTTTSSTRLRLGLLPTPFLGNPGTARVLVLQLNPGFEDSDTRLNRRHDFVVAARANLRHKRTKYPTFTLDPRWKSSAGGRWLRQRLCKLLAAVDDDPESAELKVAHRLMIVDFHGYHARRYQQIPVTLPSQNYSFELVRRAIAYGHPVVLARGERQWKVAVPELESYEWAFTMSNPRSTYVTPACLGGGRTGDSGFNLIVDAINSARLKPMG